VPPTGAVVLAPGPAAGTVVLGVFGAVDRVASGAGTVACLLSGAVGVGAGVFGVLAAVVGTDVDVGFTLLAALGAGVGCSIATGAVALGVLAARALGLAVPVVGVLLGVALALATALRVGVASMGVVAPLGDGVGVGDPAVRAAAAARSASATSAVIRSRACCNCASRSAELNGLAVVGVLLNGGGKPVGDAVGWRFGVLVTVYPLSVGEGVGVGVAVESAAPGVGEAAPTASCCATGELVGVGLASGVALVRSGASDASSSPAPDSPVSGMRAV